MDPISAAGLAGTALTFLDIGIRSIKTVKEIKSSQDGATQHQSELLQQAERLNTLSTELKSCPSVGDVPLEKVVSRCAEQARELTTLLKLISNDGGTESGQLLSSMKGAAKTFRYEGKIKSLEKSLEKSRDDLTPLLIALLLQNQTSVMKSLSSVSLESTYFAEHHRKDMAVKTQEVLSRIDTLEHNITAAQSVKESLESFSNQQQIMTQDHQLLETLRFANMYRRYRRIARAHADSFDWIFQDDHEGQAVHFGKWLTSGSGLYWIRGKPGCGKSTLMKHIWDNPQTKQCLKIWNQGSLPYIASYFFWVGGGLYERSLEGLLRSLLFELLAQQPELIQDLRKHDVEDPGRVREDLDLERLETLFAETVNSDRLQGKICIFIDGLDEFKGPARLISTAIAKLASAQNVKVCVSSRDWNEIGGIFNDAAEMVLTVHEHTVQDIRKYIRGCLEEEPLFKRLRDSDHGYQSVISNIILKAKGVFLWVSLVVQDLVNNLDNQDSMIDFERRVSAFPDDLEAYFVRMLDSIPAVYQQQSASILLMLLNSLSCTRLEQLHPILIEGVEPLQLQIDTVPRDVLDKRNELGRTRLLARCKDLLEVGLDSFVEFLHRTVIDFLRTPNVYARLRVQTSPSFDPHFALCESKLYQLKTQPWRFDNNSRDKATISLALSSTLPDLLLHAGAANTTSLATRCQLLDNTEQSLRTVFTQNKPEGYYAASQEFILTEPRTSGGLHPDRGTAWTDVVRYEGFVLTWSARLGFNWYISHRLPKFGHRTVRLKSGAHFNLRNELLKVACRNGVLVVPDVEIMELAKAGIRPGLNSSESAALTSITWDIKIPMLEMLLKAGADPNAELIYNRSAWFTLLRHLVWNLDTISMAMFGTDGSGAAASHTLAKLPEVFRLFLSQGADPTIMVTPNDLEEHKQHSIEWIITQSFPKYEQADLLRRLAESRRHWHKTHKKSISGLLLKLRRVKA